MRYIGKDRSFVYLKCRKCKSIGSYSKDEFKVQQFCKCKTCGKSFGFVWGMPPSAETAKLCIPYLLMTLLAVATYYALNSPYLQKIFYFNSILTSLNSLLVAILIPVLCSILPLILEGIFYNGQEKRIKERKKLLMVIVLESLILILGTVTTIENQYVTLQITDPDTGEQLEYFGNSVGDIATGKGRLFNTQGELVYFGEFKDNQYDGYGEKYEEVTSIFDPNLLGTHCLTYKGLYKNGVPHGKGSEYRYDAYYDFNKGEKDLYLYYEGDFDGGEYCGFGTLYGNAKKYEGSFYDGQYNGYGILYELSSDDKVQKYVGMYVDGKLNGKGKWYRLNGSVVYDGSWKNGKLDGLGTSYYEDGSIRYVGEWKDDEHNGEGKIYWPNGTISYDGLWENGKRSGLGTSYYEDGSIRYVGEWKDDKYNGEGKLYRPNGTISYDGLWKNSNADDLGTSYYEDGSVQYVGEWKDGKINGEGKIYWPNGTISYDGLWENGKQSGLGTSYYEDGNIQYVGEWKDSKPNGKGTLYLSNKYMFYDGEFLDGRMHGHGTYYHKDGTPVDKDSNNS